MVERDGSWSDWRLLGEAEQGGDVTCWELFRDGFHLFQHTSTILGKRKHGWNDLGETCLEQVFRKLFWSWFVSYKSVSSYSSALPRGSGPCRGWGPRGRAVRHLSAAALCPAGEDVQDAPRVSTSRFKVGLRCYELHKKTINSIFKCLVWFKPKYRFESENRFKKKIKKWKVLAQLLTAFLFYWSRGSDSWLGVLHIFALTYRVNVLLTVTNNCRKKLSLRSSRKPRSCICSGWMLDRCFQRQY